MDEDQGRIARLEALAGGSAAVAAAVIDDPEDARCRAIGLLGHHRRNQAVEGGDAGGWFTAPGDAAAPHVPGGEIGQRPAAGLLVFHAHRLAGAGRAGRAAPAPGYSSSHRR